MVLALAEDGIMDLAEFATCADWELAGGYSVVDGKRVKDDGLLEKFDVGLEEAQYLVMTARVSLGIVDPSAIMVEELDEDGNPIPAEETVEGDTESIVYPFHKPNLIIAHMEYYVEVFASFSKKDHYCVIITSNKSIIDFGPKLKKMLFAMKDLGIYYVETMVKLDREAPISFLTENDFLPSAIYPAMKEDEHGVQDYVLLTKTMVPLDFSEISIHDSFRPYLNLYAKQWIEQHLNTLEVNS